MLTESHKKQLQEAAKEGLLPYNVPCPCKCRYCYERNIKSLIPSAEQEFIPKFNEESFSYYYNELIKHRKTASLTQALNYLLRGNKIIFRNCCDFFALGLTHSQAEKLLDMHDIKSHKEEMIHTTGYNAEIEMIKNLSKKYPFLEVWLSALTFNESIKRIIFPNSPSTNKLREVIAASRRLDIYLLYFSHEQILKDLKLINKIAPNKPKVIINKLYYNDFQDEEVKKIANSELSSFRKLVNYLYVFKRRFKNIEDIYFLSPSGAYVWKWRHKIKEILDAYHLNNHDAVLCSEGSYHAMKLIISDNAKLRAVPNSWGGLTDFSLGISSRKIIEIISNLKKEDIKRVFLPSSIWWIENKYDHEGISFEQVKEKFPEIEIIKIDIPQKFFSNTLTLKECYIYFRDVERKNRKTRYTSWPR